MPSDAGRRPSAETMVCEDFAPGVYAGYLSVWVLAANEVGPVGAYVDLPQATVALRKAQRLKPHHTYTVHRLPLGSSPCYDLL